MTLEEFRLHIRYVEYLNVEDTDVVLKLIRVAQEADALTIKSDELIKALRELKEELKK